MNGAVVWITGLPSAGKSTLADRVWRGLLANHRAACVLDGDAVRAVMKPAPGYEPAARDAFYLTLAGLGAILARQGLVVLVPATAHLRQYRAVARGIAPRFIEVYVDVPVERCAERDAKGLYASVRQGQLRGLPGIDVAYEPPEAPEVVARGGHDEAAVAEILRLIR